MFRNILFCTSLVIIFVGCGTKKNISSDKDFNGLMDFFQHKPIISLKLVSKIEQNSIDNPVLSKTEIDTVLTVQTDSIYFVKTKYKIYVHDNNVQLHLFSSDKTAVVSRNKENSELDFYDLINLINYCANSCVSYTKSNTNSDITYNIILPPNNELYAEKVKLILTQNTNKFPFKSIVYTSKTGTHKFQNYCESTIELRVLDYLESDPHQFSLKPSDYYRIDRNTISLQGYYSNYKMEEIRWLLKIPR